jgi:TatD DNase family protein
MESPLVDIGLNLTHDSFDSDLHAVLARANAAGVRHMLITGSSLANTAAAISLAKQFPDRLRATAGIHPHHAGEFKSTDVDQLRSLLMQPEVLATGECGLDYFRNFSSHDDQERVFRLQLELACESRKPLFLHQRDAHDPFVSILNEYLTRTAGGVAHCFTAEEREARAYLDMGLYIGITGWICDERRGQHLRDVVRHIPLNRILVETDAPYLLPRDLKPKPSSRRNEPAFLPHIVNVIARCRGETPETIATASTANALTLFGWPSLSNY